MKVQVKLSGGSVHVGDVEVDVGNLDVDERRLQAAALAWSALTKNGVFEVDGVKFSARDCAEWWA